MRQLNIGRRVFYFVSMAALLAAALAACAPQQGENRPGVTVLPNTGGTVAPGGTPSGSASASVSVSGGAVPAGSEVYTPVSGVAPHAALALDIRDLNAILAPAASGGSVDWTAALRLYEEGANSLKGDGSKRTLQELATTPSVLAEFPNGAAVFGNESFLDANIRAGLQGVGRGEGASDAVRRQLTAKGASAILYGKILQELTAARAKIEAGNLDPASGAAHNVDEAWAFYVGAADNTGARPYALSAVAKSREGNFNLAGKVDRPLQEALLAAQTASLKGDRAAFDAAAADVKGHLNTIFYLATLRYGGETAKDTEEAARAVHLAEGWAFYQPIRPLVAGADAEADQTIEGLYTGAAAEPVTADDVAALYASLNHPAVLEALGIPTDAQVSAAP